MMLQSVPLRALLPVPTSKFSRPFHSQSDRRATCSSRDTAKSASKSRRQQSQQHTVSDLRQQRKQVHHLVRAEQSSIPAERPLRASAALGCAAAVAALPLLSLPTVAVALHAEPQNALSLPTWAIHVSSVLEWIAAMALVWRYADVSDNPRWKGLTWGMMPLLAGAMCACTHHFFYNDPQLDVLVALQAFFTVVGNTTCWFAAYRIYAAAKADKAGA